MMKYHFTAVLMVWRLLLTAQAIPMLADKNIVWAAETEQICVVDDENFNEELTSGVTVLKLLRTKSNASAWGKPYLASLVLQAASDGQLVLYADPELTRPLKRNESPFFDTIVTFDPATYEEKIVVASHEITPERIDAWRVRQVIGFNRKTGTWEGQITAVGAVLMHPEYRQADSVPADRMYTLFWFKPEQRSFNPRSRRITWAASVKSMLHRNHLNLFDATVLKMTDEWKYPMQYQLRQFETDPQAPMYETESCTNYYPFAEREHLLHRTDSVAVFDPETYEEFAKVDSTHITFETIRYMRLCHNWYWDERKKRLSIVLTKTAPIIEIRDDWRLRYFRPLFYQKVKP